MTIGEVIRKYRKKADMTQEEMANRLGVTTPAVNKWENNNTQPDVALLAPIARLLGITTDTLLSYRDSLTDEEIRSFIRSIGKASDEKSYAEVFAAAKRKIGEYPNCGMLIWQAAAILDAQRMAKDIQDKDKYEDEICDWYEQCLKMDNEAVRNQAADSLFHAYVRKEKYDRALEYAGYLSRENPERRRMEALIFSKTGRKNEAYRAYEELLLSGYNRLQLVLNDLRLLYMEDNNHEMANKMVEVTSTAASTFEMGRYSEVCAGLDNAVWEKDVARTVQVMTDILDSLETLGSFTRSKLYQHMVFKENDPDFIDNIREEILKLLDDESYSYMRGNERWEKIIKSR